MVGKPRPEAEVEINYYDTKGRAQQSVIPNVEVGDLTPNVNISKPIKSQT